MAAVVFPGVDGTSAMDVAAALGPNLDAIFVFEPPDQIYRVYRPDAPIPALNAGRRTPAQRPQSSSA